MNLLTYIDLNSLFQASMVAQILVAAFLAVLFLQSGIDKVVDWKGNLSWLTGHFKDSPLSNMVPLMLGTITIFEIAAGLLSAIGAVMLLLGKGSELALYGAQLSALSILMLFFGQRLAKDYAGAATLVSYFILSIIGILILG
ncbi:MAG: DoxX family protein [Flammeovirgaceae bacterium]